ncbi:alpha/beta hydrolase [Nocardia sp. NPDC050713]|uniref:RBBP9/YdeN family alpha/beta hydrolase n=1 Tax=Nocardia sp. NPDC050713 TaxID=3154511 RepID=UPI0033D1010B
MNTTVDPTVVLVPGLAPTTVDHWQYLLAQRLPKARIVEPAAHAPLSREARTAALGATVSAIAGPVVLVAHSAGVLTTVHWAQQPTRPILGALLATPPDFELPLPEGFPSRGELERHGWNTIPRQRLPFPSIVAASTNDALASFRRVAGMAEAWGARLVDLGPVRHLNPASGFGHWPDAEGFVNDLSRTQAAPAD